ncbi:aminodeoxychorismate synthase component I [Candidatus Woesearchaeota archaeon]|nr:aminodeoxychorismate synthase component I [Candidatus Woesearchaeota archaeon]
MTTRIEELPYFEDSATLFMPWAERNGSVFLDSGYPHCRQGRYDILAAEPVATLVTRGHLTEIRASGAITLSPENPFSLLKTQLGTRLPQHPDLPFCGGAIGYFGYDLARRLEKIPDLAADEENIPDMIVGIYDWAVIVDHTERRSWLAGRADSPALAARWPHLLQSFSQIQILAWQQTGFSVLSGIESNLSRAEYGRAFRRVQHYIHEGDCYQVNLTQRFSACCRGNPWAAYQGLRVYNPAPFSAFLHYPQVQVLSSSPERFLKVRDGQVETRPIKGTRPRFDQPARDRAEAEALRQSTKDRAENLMIVDLLRNDLGKNCVPGSVHVPRLFDIESYATVHHLVSTVCGQLAGDQSALDLLKGCFPGGSITGAPKIRAMQIIEELEPHRRGLYCGAIGYIGFDGNMDCNIAIRTLMHSDNRIRFWAGGGIVADSDEEQEYQECHHKASALLNLLEQFRVKRRVGSLGG